MLIVYIRGFSDKKVEIGDFFISKKEER